MRRVACWTLTLLVGCGEAPASPREAALATSGDESRAAAATCVDRTHGGCVTREPARAPTTANAAAPPSALGPLGRRDRSAATTEPELAAAEAVYARLVATPYGPTAPSSTQAGIEQLL